MQRVSYIATMFGGQGWRRSRKRVGKDFHGSGERCRRGEQPGVEKGWEGLESDCILKAQPLELADGVAVEF